MFEIQSLGQLLRQNKTFDDVTSIIWLINSAPLESSNKIQMETIEHNIYFYYNTGATSGKWACIVLCTGRLFAKHSHLITAW